MTATTVLLFAPMLVRGFTPFPIVTRAVPATAVRLGNAGRLMEGFIHRMNDRPIDLRQTSGGLRGRQFRTATNKFSCPPNTLKARNLRACLRTESAACALTKGRRPFWLEFAARRRMNGK